MLKICHFLKRINKEGHSSNFTHIQGFLTKYLLIFLNNYLLIVFKKKSSFMYTSNTFSYVELLKKKKKITPLTTTFDSITILAFLSPIHACIILDKDMNFKPGWLASPVIFSWLCFHFYFFFCRIFMSLIKLSVYLKALSFLNLYMDSLNGKIYILVLLKKALISYYTLNELNILSC